MKASASTTAWKRRSYLAEASFLWCTVRPAAVTADPLRSSGFRCVYGVLLCGRGSPTHPNPLDRQVFDMGSNERDECMNEIRLLQSMDHPHIIDYLSCVIEHNELTVVMELAEQGDLSDLIKAALKAQRPLSEVQVWRHFSQIADALAYMHEKRRTSSLHSCSDVAMNSRSTSGFGPGSGMYSSAYCEIP